MRAVPFYMFSDTAVSTLYGLPLPTFSRISGVTTRRDRRGVSIVLPVNSIAHGFYLQLSAKHNDQDKVYGEEIVPEFYLGCVF